jgi:hypothetical protein
MALLRPNMAWGSSRGRREIDASAEASGSIPVVDDPVGTPPLRISSGRQQELFQSPPARAAVLAGPRARQPIAESRPRIPEKAKLPGGREGLAQSVVREGGCGGIEIRSGGLDPWVALEEPHQTDERSAQAVAQLPCVDLCRIEFDSRQGGLNRPEDLVDWSGEEWGGHQQGTSAIRDTGTHAHAC